MIRREFISLLGGAAAWPLAAQAQQPERMRRIGVLMGTEDDAEGQARLTAFRRGLLKLGWEEQKNVQIHARFGGSNPQRYQRDAIEVVGLNPDVILGSNTPIIQALKRATQTIPIVFVSLSDPVGSGIVSSLAQPGGNATGLSNFEYSISGKWLELLTQISPSLAHVAFVFNSITAPFAPSYLQFGEESARKFGIKATAIDFQDATSLEQRVGSFARDPDGGLVVFPDGSTTTHREAIINLAARHRLPAIYPFRFFITSGGLAAYAADLFEQYSRVATYIDHILRGAKPAALPVQVPTKFDLLINLKLRKGARPQDLRVAARPRRRGDRLRRERRMNSKCQTRPGFDTFSAKSADLTGLKMIRITRDASFDHLVGASNCTRWARQSQAPWRSPR